MHLGCRLSGHIGLGITAALYGTVYATLLTVGQYLPAVAWMIKTGVPANDRLWIALPLFWPVGLYISAKQVVTCFVFFFAKRRSSDISLVKGTSTFYYCLLGTK